MNWEITLNKHSKFKILNVIAPNIKMVLEHLTELGVKDEQIKSIKLLH